MSTRIAIFSILFLISTFSLKAQYPYRLSGGVDAPLIGGGTILYTTSYFLNRRSPPITLEYLEKMNPFKPNFIDRIDPKVSQRVDWKAHRRSNIFLYGSNAMLALTPLLAGNRSRERVPTTYFILLEGLLVNGAVTSLTKAIFKRPRPFAFGNTPPELISEQLMLQRNTLRSFFSGHTSLVAVNSFMTAKVLTDFYPESRMKPVIWTGAVLLPAITGYLRVKSGKHFITDVLVGFLIGGTVGWLVPQLHL